jgi:hypothetical protein
MNLASMIAAAQQRNAQQLQAQASAGLPAIRQFGDVTITPQNAAQYNTSLGEGDQTGTLPGYQQALDDLITQTGGGDQMGSQWTHLSQLFQQPGFADKFFSMYPAARNYVPSYLQSGMVQATGADNGYGSLADIAPMILAIGGGALGAAAGAGAEGASAAGAIGSEGASPMLLADAGTTMTDVGAGYGAGSGSLGGGITPGAAATGIGAGAAGTGLTAGTTASGVGGGALGTGVTGSGTALGTFGSESLYPVLGGTAAAAGATGLGATAGSAGAGAGTTAGAAAGGSALSRILDGSATTGDYADLLGKLGAAGLGAYGANEQSNRLRDIYNDMATKRQPFLDKSVQYMNDPASYAAGPGAANLDAVLRRLSVNGNPANNPTSLGIATQAGLSDWRNAVTGFGNLGLSGEDTRANVATNAATAAGNVYGDIGYGLGAITAPRRNTLGDYLKGLA